MEQMTDWKKIARRFAEEIRELEKGLGGDVDVLEEVGKAKGIAIAADLLHRHFGMPRSRADRVAKTAERAAERMEERTP